MYRCILQGRKPATCQFRRCSKCITGGYYPPLRRFCCHNAIKSRRAGACSRVNCTQCKRHEAPNASAFGRNSPGDCFVASALIPPSLPTATHHLTGARPLCRCATSPHTVGSHPLQGERRFCNRFVSLVKGGGCELASRRRDFSHFCSLDISPGRVIMTSLPDTILYLL